MLPTRLIRRNLTRAAFVIPVFWFIYFLISLYLDDLANSDNGGLDLSKKNLLKSKSKTVKVPIHTNISQLVKQHDTFLNKIDRFRKAKLKQAEIDNSDIKDVKKSKPKEDLIKEGKEPVHVNVHNEEDRNDGGDKQDMENKGKAVLAPPNHPEKQLIDPNAPGKGLLETFHLEHEVFTAIGADPEFLERGFRCVKEGVEVRFADYISFLVNIHDNEIIWSQ